MIYNYSPEMGEKEPLVTIEKRVGHLKVLKKGEIEMKLKIGYYGDYYIDTEKELTGKGIKKVSDSFIDRNGNIVSRNKYKVTDFALKKLQKIYDIKREVMLD